MKEFILSEIKRLSEEMGGASPGKKVFETRTGITEGQWYGVYWARWSDAIREAGLKPNEKNVRYDSEYLLERLASAVRHYGRGPGVMELRMFKRINPGFPDESTMTAHFGGKDAMMGQFREWIAGKIEYADLIEMLPQSDKPEPQGALPTTDGLVYLLKSGQHYKIGRSDNLERRVKEITVALPESIELVHAIRTDDPVGIEAYWHRRFDGKRANGEWFKLDRADVVAFRKRKFQ